MRKANPPDLKGAFGVWLSESDARGRRQPPGEVLQGEHYLMESVLRSMEAELEHMLAGASLRTDFWGDVIDFNGNFVHLCHRVKEEDHLIPALVECQLIDADQHEGIQREHDRAKDLTLAIRDGVEEGDWEKVLRLVALYSQFLRPHMRREEDEAFLLAATELPPEVSDEIRARFDRVDAAALGASGRVGYVDLARRLTALAGVEYDLTSPSNP